MQIHFQIEGDPKGKGRPRFTRAGKFTRVYTDKQTLDYESLIKSFAMEAMGSTDPLETAVSVFLYIRHPIPKSYSKKRTEACLSGLERPTKKPDWDNVSKTICDAMNGIVYLDDAQVVNAHVTKVYASNAGVDVMVMEVE
jgi:Holliday junction resolvase RusA-like endonuclease